MRAMLLCAGLGSRLGALSDQRPKPMLPVCGMPILRYGIAQLVAPRVAGARVCGDIIIISACACPRRRRGRAGSRCRSRS